MVNDPVGQQGQHAFEVGLSCKPMIGTGQDLQSFDAREGIEESTALMERDIFIRVPLGDQGRRGDGAGRFIGDALQAVFIKGKVERNTPGASMEVGNAVGGFPLLKPLLAQLQQQFFAEIDDRTLQRKAGERRNRVRLRAMSGHPFGGRENR